MNYCPLPITHPARAWLHSDHTTAEHLAELFEQHAPILVCPIEREENDG